MQFRTHVRALMTSAALAASVLLAGCNSEEIGTLATNAKANQPVPPKLIQAMVEKDMDLQSPILVRKCGPWCSLVRARPPSAPA